MTTASRLPDHRFSGSTASVLLDAARGIAASLVLLEHWRNAFFVDFAQILSHRVLFSPIYLLCSVGHQAVVIFFVLSGYLISGSVLRCWRRKEWSWQQYAIHRLVRLWIVLLPAVILGICFDCVGIFSHQAPALYSGTNYNHITPDVQHALSATVVAGNVLFLQTIKVPPLGSNGALWSLSNEFWYYVLFPLALCVGLIYRKATQKAICGVLLCVVVGFVGRGILLAFPIWLLGALLHAVPRKPTALWLRWAAAGVYAPILFSTKKWPLPPAIGDLVLGIFTFALIWILLGAVKAAKDTVACRLSRSLARFSFTLYVAHTPALILLVALSAHDTRWVPTVKTSSMAFCVLALLVVYAWVLARATEFKTDQVRQWVERKLSSRREGRAEAAQVQLFFFEKRF